MQPFQSVNHEQYRTNAILIIDKNKRRDLMNVIIEHTRELDARPIYLQSLHSQLKKSIKAESIHLKPAPS